MARAVLLQTLKVSRRPPLPPMTYDFCTLTDTGRVRTNNEDAVSFDPQTQVAVLADGMGGYNAGEVASEMACTSIRTEMALWLTQTEQRPARVDVWHALQTAAENANDAILNTAYSDPQCEGMGTTVVVAVFIDQQLILGHLGDSRGYRLRNGKLVQLTRDHSWLQEQVDAGHITPQQAAASSARNLVTRALGVEVPVVMEINDSHVHPGDLFLLCSDGLTDMVPDREIEQLLCAPTALQEKAQQLIDAANAHGGRDNVSVLLVQSAAGTKKSGLVSRWLGAL